MASGKLTAFTAALLLSTAAARADVEISNKPTSNMSCDAGVCTATAQKAVLNVSDLAAMLASGDVAVKTGTLAKDIDLDQPLQWTSTARLTLDAQQSVTINKQVTVAGQGALTVVTNDTGAKSKNKIGEFIIVPEHGSVQFWDLSSSLIIDGNSYTLVGDIKTLASDIAANPSGFYALAKPYDASVDGTYSSSPTAGVLFQGTFEGLGNEISNFYMQANGSDGADFTGLFATVGDKGNVRNLGLRKAYLKATRDDGALLADGNSGQIVRCWVRGKVRFDGTFAGVLSAYNSGAVEDSYADVTITSSHGTIAGALVGYNFNTGSISKSYALGSVAFRNGSESNLGGLVGENKGTIENSFARNRVKAGRGNNASYFGGLVGRNDSSGHIADSYAAGEITAGSTSGGLVGFDGAVAGHITNSYWDLDTGVSDPNHGAANVENDPGITGLTTAQFQATLPAGFDEKVWAIQTNINEGFPYLRAFH